MRHSLLRATLAVSIALAPAVGRAQGVDPVFQRGLDALVAKIDAAALTPDIKNTLKSYARARWSPQVSQRELMNDLMLLEQKMDASVKALALVDAAVAEVNANTVLPPQTKERYVAKIGVQRRNIPDANERVPYELAGIKSDVAQVVPAVNAITDWGRAMAASNAPPILKQYIADDVATMLTAIYPMGAGSATTMLGQSKAARKYDFDLLDTIDKFRIAVASEVPPEWPELKVNTFREIDARRLNVGNPANVTNLNTWGRFELSYKEHLGWARKAAEIMKLTEPKGLMDMKVAQKGALRVQLAVIMLPMLDYRTVEVKAYLLDDYKKKAEALNK